MAHIHRVLATGAPPLQAVALAGMAIILARAEAVLRRAAAELGAADIGPTMQVAAVHLAKSS